LFEEEQINASYTDDQQSHKLYGRSAVTVLHFACHIVLVQSCLTLIRADSILALNLLLLLPLPSLHRAGAVAIGL
jgi:hypothetical protein